MGKKCCRCGRPIATKKYHCDECSALVASRTAVVHLRISPAELDILAEVLEKEAADWRCFPGPHQEAGTLEEYAKFFRDHAGYERTAQAEDARWAAQDLEAKHA